MREGQAVEYVGGEDGENDVWSGHPGRVVAVHLDDVAVAWVNGPSWDLPVREVRPISEAAYLARGDRLVRLVHPLRDTPVDGFTAPGEEWPDGRRPDP